MRAVLLLIIALLSLVTAFAVQNSGDLTVRFLHLSWLTSLPVVIVAAFAAGVLVGILWGVPSSLRRRRRIRELTTELDSHRRPPASHPPEKP